MKSNKYRNRLKQLFSSFKDYSLEDRLLISTLLAGILISIIGFLFSLIISSSVEVLIITSSLFAILSLIYYFVRIRNNFNLFRFPLIIIAILGISVIWIFDGGINGANMFPAFVILILSLIIVNDNKKKYVIMLFIASIASIYFIQLKYPEWITGFESEKMRWLDSLITVVYSSFFIYLIIKYLHKNYTIERQKAEETAKKLKAVNNTKDKLFTIIAHDLRSPFHSILGLTDLLMQKGNEIEYEELERYIALINSSAKSTSILLDNLLNWAKSQIGQFKVDVKEVEFSIILDEVVSILLPSAKIKNISINYNRSVNSKVFADGNMLNLILRNLISNSIKFTDKGGEINIDEASKGQYVEISVSDNGVGMKDDIADNLFTLSTENTSEGTENEKGTGLGLIICKEFVEKLNGKIWAESEFGKGSSFKFTLPAVK